MTNNSKVIGLLGGMSWPSTITYYRGINQLVQRRLGGSHSARVLIWSDDYEHVEQMQLDGRWDDAGEWLGQSALRLRSGGAQLLGIACNTMHRVSSAVRNCVDIPLVDMIEVAAKEASLRNSSKVALLGTRFTVSMGRYSEELAKRGIDTVLPDLKNQELIDDMIYKELCLGKVLAKSREALRSVICRLAAGGADTIMLACTEFGLLVEESCVDGVQIIDSASVHIRSLVEASLDD